MLLGIARLIVLVLDTLLFVPIVLLASLADPEARLGYRIARYWAWFNVRLAGARLRVEGLERIDPQASYVFISNHRSNLDVIAVVTALWDFQLRWVAKRELTRIPGFGWAIRATKQIIVDRRDHAQAVASLEAARTRVRNGLSVVFFPEGHRSEGPLLPFKKGGFVFAIETGLPIVPIAIIGTGAIMPRSDYLVRRGGDVRIVIGEPIPTTGLGLDDRDALLAQVRDVIGAAAEGRAPEVGAPVPWPGAVGAGAGH